MMNKSGIETVSKRQSLPITSWSEKGRRGRSTWSNIESLQESRGSGRPPRPPFPPTTEPLVKEVRAIAITTCCETKAERVQPARRHSKSTATCEERQSPRRTDTSCTTLGTTTAGLASQDNTRDRRRGGLDDHHNVLANRLPCGDLMAGQDVERDGASQGLRPLTAVSTLADWSFWSNDEKTCKVWS